MPARLPSRRAFVASALASGAAVAATASGPPWSGGGIASAASAATPAADAPRPRGKYIDIHTHLGTFYWGKELTADELVRMMDRHGVERAVVLPLVSPESSPYPQTTEAALAAHRSHPDRLIPFCAVDPRVSTGNPRRYGHVAGVPGLVEILARYKELGARGLGEHKVGLPFDHPLMMALYEACDRLGLPILFHLDDIRSFDAPGLPRLENALQAFPRLPLIGHAAGFWASISGDATIEDFGRYPEVPKPVTPGGTLDRLMAKYPNLYGDLSEPGGEKALARDPKFGREFLIRRADHLLFGTDFLMTGQEVPQFDLLDSMNLPADVAQKIFRGNAERLLKLEA